MNRFLLFATFFILCSCNGGVSPLAYMEAVNDAKSGLIKNISIGNFKVDIEYKTHEFMVINEMIKTEEGFSEDVFKSSMADQRKLETFFIRFNGNSETDFLKQDLSDKNQYYERLNYFNGIVQEDLSLIDGKDTLPCTYTYFERNYGVGQKSTLIVGFEKTNQNKSNMKLIFNERALGIGSQEFVLLKSTQDNLPQIIF
jgi:hypothetical protein